MERLALWLCAGLTLFGFPGYARCDDPMDEADAASGAGGAGPAQPFLGGFLRASRIVYPLSVGEWNAVDEHLYDDQAYGVSVRYAHDHALDRWIDVYFYPAGVLTEDAFLAAAREETELIRLAQEDAGVEHFEMGALRAFPLDPGGAREYSHGIDPQALELRYEVGGKAYSSAMTLLLHRMYFIKARYSVEERTLPRGQALAQLQAFTAQLHARVSIRSTCRQAPARSPAGADADVRLDSIDAAFPPVQAVAPAPAAVPAGMREIRLAYRAADLGDPDRSRGDRRFSLG